MNPLSKRYLIHLINWVVTKGEKVDPDHPKWDGVRDPDPFEMGKKEMVVFSSFHLKQ